VRGGVSFVLGDVGGDGRDEALLSVVEEPFATRNVGPTVPRFILRISSDSELVGPLEELFRNAGCRLQAGAGRGAVAHEALTLAP
jgi:hypothetical protein